MNMITVKIGKFPGSVNEFVLEEGTTVRKALNLAGIEVAAEQEIKLDGEVVAMDAELDESSALLLVTKRLKGAVR